MKLISILSLFFIFGCKNYIQREGEQAINPNLFISFTDLHFTPYADSLIVENLVECDFNLWDSIFQSSGFDSYGTYGDETNYVLFTEALAHMKLNNLNPDFIIISGDFICHHFGDLFQHFTGNISDEDMHAFLKKTMQFLVAKIEITFPNTSIFPTLGNNDAYCGDYQIDMEGTYLEMFAELFHPLINMEMNDSTILFDLKMDGCYMATNPIKADHKIIAFNSIVFTPKYQSKKYERHCDCSNVNQDSLAEVQFAWLEKQLEICKQHGNNVWLLTHVPPGVDIFSTLRKDKVVTYWVEKYAETFKSIIDKYSDLIKVTMVGHTHMDDFKIVFNNEDPVSYIHITPSISPIFGNNPVYQSIFYNSSNATFTNYNSFNVELADTINTVWQKEYNYNSCYGNTNFTPEGKNLLYKKLVSDSTLRQHYFNYYPSGSKAGSFITLENWDAYKCGNVNILDQNYSACVKP